jgi:hypothetical protein
MEEGNSPVSMVARTMSRYLEPMIGHRALNSLNNWCPIMLLNVTYKIFGKALHMRLQPILTEVIYPVQSAFLPMRFILDNIFLT